MFVVLIAIVSAIWHVNVNSTNALLNFLIVVPEGGSEAVKVSLALEEAIVALLSFWPSRVLFFSPPFTGFCISAFLSSVSKCLQYFFNKDPLITSCLSLCCLMDCCTPCCYGCLGLVLTYSSSPIRKGGPYSALVDLRGAFSVPQFWTWFGTWGQRRVGFPSVFSLFFIFAFFHLFP